MTKQIKRPPPKTHTEIPMPEVKPPKTKEPDDIKVKVLQDEIAELRAMVAELTKAKVETVQLTKLDKPKDEHITDDEYTDIPPNKRIKIINLSDSKLILVAGEYNQGKPYIFNKFGEVRTIIYSDLAEILHYHYRFAEQGYFYICDKAAVSNNGLSEVYSKLLTKEMIDRILDYETKDMIDMFEMAGKTQQDNIVSLIIRRVNDGEQIDLNKVDSLSRIFGRNINEMIEDIRKYKEQDME
jgi:hypothetical protein